MIVKEFQKYIILLLEIFHLVIEYDYQLTRSIDETSTVVAYVNVC